MEGFDNDENLVYLQLWAQCMRQYADSAEVRIQSSELPDD
jgi:hypothetical protein